MTIVRQKISKNTFQTAGTAKTPGGAATNEVVRLPNFVPSGTSLTTESPGVASPGVAYDCNGADSIDGSDGQH